jgi:eukaryotic-like serine/threonine-protein kinase
MSNPRDPSVDGRSRAGGAEAADVGATSRAAARRSADPPAQPVRDPTESLAIDDDRDAAWSEASADDLDPLSSSRAPLGTRDAPRSAATRVESPAARNRTPAPAPPVDAGSGRAPAPTPGGRRPRASRPPRPRDDGERPEERIGSVLDRRYRLLALIGRGGMGFVYRAEHVELGRPAAVKLLRADYARRRDSVERFKREAQTVNRVRHRNIVDVPDIGWLDDGTTFIVMELLEGQSLGKWARGGFSTPRALALLVQICDGLAAAHTVGVIHRDLKPDNIMVVPTGDGAEQIKLLDFGVAKLVHREDEDVALATQAGSVIGTPAYMSPEQAGGTAVDARSDIYSLGAIMYELFTGQPMFKGRSFGEFVRKHLGEAPVPPRQTPGGAGIDDRLEQAILRCLEKDPDRRYPTIGALRDDLLHLLGGIDTQVGGVRALAMTDSLGSGDLLPASARRSAAGSARHGAMPTPQPTPRPLPTALIAPPPRRWPWVAAGAAVGAAALGIAVGIATSGAPPAPPSTAAAERAASPSPAVIPIGAPAARPASGSPRTIDVRFESTPPADVYRAGSARKQCSTPCTVSIDPSDGGATTHRDFVVRAPGHRDRRVTLDLAAPAPVLAVTLEPRAAAAGDDRARRPRRGEAGAAGEPAAPAPAAAVERAPAPPAEARPEAPAGRQERIDPSDTIDPFGARP